MFNIKNGNREEHNTCAKIFGTDVRRGDVAGFTTIFTQFHPVTVIVAPMTTKGRNYSTRVMSSFQDKKGQVVLDQIRTIDKRRLIKKLGSIDSKSQNKVLDILQEMFAK